MKNNEETNKSDVICLMARDIVNGDQKLFDGIFECIEYYTKKSTTGGN